ncbi:hypothetical protein FACS189452_10570 [Bacteroidia bacterium]|nr:hypothetical protein FACS189452_10570 [Bacteroidia bacterium]GHT82672.1 hypothetical protein FACS189467_8060 [Bacteroidia bacterium]
MKNEKGLLYNSKTFTTFAPFVNIYLRMKYTLIVKQGQNGFLIGMLKEFPDVFTQGLTLAELKENIADALAMHLDDLRERYVPQGNVFEEELIFA